MMNSKRIAELVEENNKLKEVAAKQSATIKKAMKVINDLINENMMYQAALQVDTFEFPIERGLGEGDTPTDLSPLDL